MRLPNAERAVIPREKLIGYLLSTTHPYGRHKAAFFAAFGFDATECDRLEAALRQHALIGEVAEVVRTRFGTKYVVTGRLETPSGRDAWVQTIWFAGKAREAPRFVTGYPAREKER